MSKPTEKLDRVTSGRMVAGIRLSAIIEMLIFFSLALSYDFLFRDADRFIDVSPHPFWVIVLLMAVQYGTKEALVATILSCFFLLAGNLPEGKILATYEYMLKILFNPFMWTGASLLIGELRVRQINERNNLIRELSKSKGSLKVIAQSYSDLKKQKEALETKIAGEMKSAVAIYDAVKSASITDNSKLADLVKQAVIASLNPEKFSVFVYNTEGLTLEFAYGWNNKDKFSKRIPADSNLFREIMSRKSLLCVVNENDENILAGEGLIAGPIIDNSSGEIFGLIKIEELPLKEFNVSTIQLFWNLCEWAGKIYSSARKYDKTKENSLIDYDKMLYSYSFYNLQSGLLSKLAERLNFDLTQINAEISNFDELPETEKNLAAKELGAAVKSTLRSTDIIFSTQKIGSKFAIILPGTPIINAQLVLQKIEEGLNSSRTPGKAKYFFSANSIYNKK